MILEITKNGLNHETVFKIIRSLYETGCSVFTDFPARIKKYLYSTNPIESLNKEMKRRVKIRIISTENSLEQDPSYVFANYNAASRKIQNYDLIKSAEQG